MNTIYPQASEQLFIILESSMFKYLTYFSSDITAFLLLCDFLLVQDYMSIKFTYGCIWSIAIPVIVHRQYEIYLMW
jgi:hypothetical protein